MKIEKTEKFVQKQKTLEKWKFNEDYLKKN